MSEETIAADQLREWLRQLERLKRGEEMTYGRNSEYHVGVAVGLGIAINQIREAMASRGIGI